MTIKILQASSVMWGGVAVGGGGRLLWCLLLILASSSCCSSQQYDQIQLSKIADSIENLTNTVIAQQRTSDKLASGLMKMFSFLASDYLPCDEGWLKLGSSCYFFSKDNFTWHESREKCIAMNSDLVKVTTDEENNFLRDHLEGYIFWVGLNDIDVEDTYVWTDGTPYKMIKSWWAPGQPDYSHERCINYWASKDNRWNDSRCSNTFRYICEKTFFSIDV
ncbi:perlucin-like protein [Palaemon carinicauda]|uniref:perlucin-like protein n=1 Tax=Palaemon carinicauda TaxID=392227 RepID=UPI0035B5B0FA